MRYTFPDIGDSLHMYLIPYVQNNKSYGRDGEQVQMAGMFRIRINVHYHLYLKMHVVFENKI